MEVSPMDISASGMRAQRKRMEVIAVNLANADTTNAGQEIVQGSDGERYVRYTPYRRKEVIFEAGNLVRGDRKFGVTVPRVVDDMTDFRKEFEPGHQHAVNIPGDADYGKVLHPNVNPIVEMVDMIAASRAYEANITAAEMFKNMSSQTLRILA